MNDAGLFTAPFIDRSVADCFSDAQSLRTLVNVEVALARAQAKIGIIPSAAAEYIAQRAATFSVDRAKLDAAMQRDGFPIIEFVAQLRQHVGGDAARFVHWGATTQDIIDTAMMLQLRTALRIIDRRLAGLAAALAKLTDQHRSTLMVGRTHLQPALPITFGLKAAGWVAPLVRHRRFLVELQARVLNVQLGGAAGTLASFGGDGIAVTETLAIELGLGVLPMPWHAQRDTILETSQRLTLIAGSVMKFAQDVLLLSQHEVGEVCESADPDRGRSSAMPQKRNPVLGETVLIAARVAADENTALQMMPVPEHERGTQTAQAERLHFPRVCAFLGGALRAAERLATGLVINAPRMQANVRATHGVLLAEAATLALSRHIDPFIARKLVQESCAVAIAEKRHLLDVIRARPEAAAALANLPRDEAAYLGSSQAFIDRVLADLAAAPAPHSA